MSDVCVIGLGHVGLPLAALMATNGFRVSGVDTNADLVRSVNAGRCSWEEPELGPTLRKAVNAGAMTAAEIPAAADIFIVAVPTPVRGDGEPDLAFVISAAESIGRCLKKDDLVIIESTIPPGATRGEITESLESASRLSAGKDFQLAYCPERAMPGSALAEITGNDRIVGGIDAASTERAGDVYSAFVKGGIIKTDAGTAELVKLAENTFRDVNIALANEIAGIAERCGVNGWDVIEMANRHPRVQLHTPGPGVGGHCLPVDPWFLVAAAPDGADLIRTARRVNDARYVPVADTALELLNGLAAPVAAVLGVSYKAGVGDVRHTPAIAIIDALQQAGVEVRACDPYVSSFTCDLVSAEEALTGADVAILVTDHPEYRRLEAGKVGSMMRNRNLVDTRNAFERETWEQAGFTYALLGDGRRPE